MQDVFHDDGQDAATVGAVDLSKKRKGKGSPERRF
jgi:hypothetical protein